MKKLYGVIKIIRPVNILIVLLSVFVAAVICANEFFPIQVIFIASLSAGSAAAAGNIINDIFDIEIDKLNKPGRPLPSELLTKNEAVILYIIFVLASITLAYFVNFTAFLVAIISNIILFFYSYRLKAVPLLGNCSVAFLTGLSFIYGGIAVNNIGYAVIPAVFAFLINAMREIVKDMEDIEGDSKNNIITFPKLKGYQTTKIIILSLGIILIAATIYPFAAKLYKVEYFILVMVVVNPVIVFIIKKLFEDHSQKSLSRISLLLKINMIFGLTAIYLGK